MLNSHCLVTFPIAVNELEELSENSWKKDVSRHPRLPLLMRHNDFVKMKFERVQRQLDHIISNGSTS